jgi:aspartate 4-decarboxylase
MLERNFKQYSKLSPFELKDQLIELASSGAQRLMLNAGRGNPNFLATLPRWAFLSLGEFALRESERSYSYLDSGFGGLPEHEGIVQRFDAYAIHHRHTDGVRFLRLAISYVKDQLGLDQGAFLFEMVSAFLGSTYPTPPRMLCHTEEIVKAYLAQEMFGPLPQNGPFSIFATEGGTAAMTYIFQSLRANFLIKPGDKIAIATPIFSPYLEIPVLDEYGLGIVDVRMDRLDDWQLPDSEIDKLLDPAVKIFCLVNPSNPPSSKLSDAVLNQLASTIAKRPDLMIVTDDVYGTFADDFVSLFAKCPLNTLLVYSFSKFFGATGWRLGAIALNHTAGLSVPQQLQMALFALNGLMDREHRYKDAAKQLIRKRYQTLYRHMGVIAPHELNDVNYYSLIDLQEIGGTLYGPEFKAWFIKSDMGISFLFRLADETGVVLLPGNGFEVIDTSARVSLANLTEIEYASIGKFTRQILDECHADFKKGIALPLQVE